MHNNLSWQILQGAAHISVNTCMFSDAYTFHNKCHQHVYFSVMMFQTNHKRQYNPVLRQKHKKRQIYLAFVRNLN